MTCNIHVEKLSEFLAGLPIYYFIVPFIIHFMFTDMLAKSAKLIEHHPPLHDIIMSNFPDWSKYSNVVNILLGFIFSFLLVFWFQTGNTEILKSFFKYFAIVILIRSITTQVTLIPSQSICTPPNGIQKYINGHCIDKIFSGHTSLSLILVILYSKYGVVNKPCLYGLIAIQILTAFMSIVTKSHYTIDIILAYIITFGVCCLFDL
jgi:hypothetical protein